MPHNPLLRRSIGLLAIWAASASIAWGASSPDVTVTEGRMQVLLPSRPAAGYFVLENHGHVPLVLSGASAPDCGSIMLHQSTMQGDMDRMTMVTSVPVPPQGKIRFSPGGYHLMCMQPSGALLNHTGAETVTLHFADGSIASASFLIQGARH